MNFTRTKLTTLLMLVVAIGVTAYAQQGRPLTNGDVIRMVQEKVDEEIIMRAIRNSEINFDVSPDGLIQLKKGKVKKQIIAAIQEIQLRKNARPVSNTSTITISPTGQPQVALPSPTPKPSPIATEHLGSYQFDLEQCSRSGPTVVCKFTITNLGEFRRLFIPLGRNINIIDSDGNQARATGSTFGLKSDNEAEIPEGVSIKYSLTFSNVPRTAVRISRLTLGVYPGKGQSITQLVFKDVPLVRIF